MIGIRPAEPAMLVLARESRSMTQAEVAQAMTKSGSDAVSQGYVSRAESGRLAVSGERLHLYAAALGYPTELLLLNPQVHGVGIGLVHHRKRASLTATALRRQHAQLALTRIQLDGIMGGRYPPAAGRASVPSLSVDAFTSAKDAAREVRTAWRMQSGPVSDVTSVVEAAGVLVVSRDLGSRRLDAVSQWDGVQAPLLLVNDQAPGDRYRFSLAHELGHLVLHRAPGDSAAQEREADDFASEFLMPARDIHSVFTGRIDLSVLAELKGRWRVSMAALLRRAHSLSAVSDWQYRSLMVEMSALGYRTAEPVEVPREQPQRVAQSVREALERGTSLERLASCACLLPEDFQQLYTPARDRGGESASKVRP
ncbi:ImmA/IrrE family metallo-endopeptidase [Streptomyces sp. AM8-1-1]|uniref:ImmA/IrrE family metallo-endopeptidase n=1 Tax=Streptomyces sp. AM8-1-1 TaxID=3075825 RepID=UPI0028C47BFC|nr:ImmA/IrrE family metallo-endopeptidase [Streptomyces sp. AM8-1-1]WNO70156.1 ImmA/IrrE family metallo-endopeptidase [Streptomyces sp. AM8-1-1]WNO76960.1 ImmA/IrrE family metallo-endopeptidase [Streptomyces sp. AM8-1-1]